MGFMGIGTWLLTGLGAERGSSLDPTSDTKNCQKKIQSVLLDMNILLSEKQIVSKQGDFKPQVVRISEACHYRMTYKVRMRKLFNLYNDWFLRWGFPDGRGLAESDYLTPVFGR